jgi:hypothetical protein
MVWSFSMQAKGHNIIFVRAATTRLDQYPKLSKPSTPTDRETTSTTNTHEHKIFTYRTQSCCNHRTRILQRSLCPSSFTKEHSITHRILILQRFAMPKFLHKATLNHRILILQQSLCPSSFTNQHSITRYLFYKDSYVQVPLQTYTQSQDTYSNAMLKFLHKPTLNHRILILQR